MTLLESNRLYRHRSPTEEPINSVQIKISSLPNFKQNKTEKTFSPTLPERILSITISLCPKAGHAQVVHSTYLHAATLGAKVQKYNKAKYVSNCLICGANNVVEQYGKRI